MFKKKPQSNDNYDEILNPPMLRGWMTYIVIARRASTWQSVYLGLDDYLLLSLQGEHRRGNLFKLYLINIGFPIQ